MDMTEDINQLVVDIWSSVLQMSAAPVPPVSRPDEVRLTGFVHISGDWEGTITVDCPLPLAASATAMMFGMEVDEVSKADIDDAIGEITNMTGGGIKSMLEGSCSLSLPTVIEGASFTVTSLGTEPIHELSYAVEDSWLAVRVLERKDEDRKSTRLNSS